MKTIKLNGREIKVYDSIDEMPIVNFQKYNKYLLIDSGIGSDVDSIDEHIIKIAKLIKANDNKKALLELQNMRQNLCMVNSEISPKHLAFAALIHSIDGKELSDLSDDSLKAVLAEINSVKRSKIVELLMWLKKKVSTEIAIYFPENFVKAKDKEVYDKIKARTLLVLDNIINGSNNNEQLELLDNALLNLYSPKCFIGSDSDEIKYDKQFENTCLLIAQKTNLDAKKMTVLQFYNAIDSIKQQAEAELKMRNKHKNK